MKKTVLLLMALMMMGTAQESMAQQRKTAVKKTTTAKKPVAKAPLVSIPMEGPAVIDGKYAYLGISLNETPANMRAQLKSKGMTIKRDYEGKMTDVRGVVDGVKVRLDVQEFSPSGCLVRQYDEKSYLLPKAKTRYNALLEKVVSIYGKGEYKYNENDRKQYQIKTDNGEICVELFNEDEMEGASDYYMIALSVTKF
jgi:hypothetical protein